MSANLQQNPSSYYLEKLKKESQQEQQQQQQSGVRYRAATKVAANKTLYFKEYQTFGEYICCDCLVLRINAPPNYFACIESS